MKQKLTFKAAQKLLAELGYKHTKPRDLIIELIENDKNHPTAYEIVQKIQKQNIHCSIATVYNTLEVLAAHGLITKLEGLESTVHYDPYTNPHFHGCCLVCKKVYNIDIDENVNYSELLNVPKELSLKNVTVQGICDKCEKKRIRRYK